MSDEDYDDAPWPAPHPRFAAHFTDAIYTDWGDDLAPFGSDEGADAMAEFYDNLDEYQGGTTLTELAAESFGDEWPVILDEPDLLADFGDAVLVALGFALIRATGAIDAESRMLLAGAIGRRGAHFESEESFATMADDLERFEA